MRRERWIRLNGSWGRSAWVARLSVGGRLAWVELLCYVKLGGVGGEVKAMDPDTAALMWRIPRQDVAEMLAAAHDDGALETKGGTWTVANWATYQPYDANNAERQARFRARKKQRTRLAVSTGGDGA